MLMANSQFSHLSYKRLTEVAHLIENTLTYDWVIKIEFIENSQSSNSGWQQWGEDYFNVVEPEDVMDSIFECHANNPVSAIRLNAEKCSPQACLYYSICHLVDS